MTRFVVRPTGPSESDGYSVVDTNREDSKGQGQIGRGLRLWQAEPLAEMLNEMVRRAGTEFCLRNMLAACADAHDDYLSDEEKARCEGARGMMNPESWFLMGNAKTSAHEEHLFNLVTGHLPKRKETTPYTSEAQAMRQIENAVKIAGLTPGFAVREVGFCLGHSASIFFHLGAKHVVSEEISDRSETMEAKRVMEERWGERFTLIRPGEQDPLFGQYDFGFVDGDHSKEAIAVDTRTMLANKVPWVLYDDFWPHWGETQVVMQEQGIAPIAILGTMALCRLKQDGD